MTHNVPLVLLHAFPLTSAIYADQVTSLADVAEVLTPDLRGFGATALGDVPPSLDVLADDVVAALDASGVERAVVGGTSMGGYVALAVLRRHPERVSGLVLANTKASADQPAARDNRERIAAVVEAEGSVRVLHEELEPKLLGATTAAARPDLVVRVHDLVAAAAPATVAWAQRAMAARPDSFDVLAASQVPVLVVSGSEDALMTADDARAMTGAALGSTSVVLDRVGHLACLEAPQAWDAAVRSWLATVG